MTPALETPVKTPTGAPKIVFFGFLILLCYAPAVKSLAQDWMINEDMGHGFFVPLVAGYIVWQERRELAATPARTNWWGMLLVLLGAAQSIVATLGRRAVPLPVCPGPHAGRGGVDARWNGPA